MKRRDVGGRIEKTRFSFAREREREREKEKEKERGGKGASPDAFDAIKEKERGRKRERVDLLLSSPRFVVFWPALGIDALKVCKILAKRKFIMDGRAYARFSRLVSFTCVSRVMAKWH